MPQKNKIYFVDTVSIFRMRYAIRAESAEKAREKFYELDKDESYNEVLLNVSEFVNGDCHAIVLDGEIIYNIYNEELSYREKINEDIVRQKIADQPHRHLFCQVLRKNKDFTVEIFMFKENPWKLVIRFDLDNSQFHLSKKI